MFKLKYFVISSRGDFRGVARPTSPPPDHFKGFRPPLNLGRCREPNLRIKDKSRTRTFFKKYILSITLKPVSKMSKNSWCKLLMLCRKGIARNFSPPPGRFSPPPEDISATPWKKSWNRPWYQDLSHSLKYISNPLEVFVLLHVLPMYKITCFLTFYFTPYNTPKAILYPSRQSYIFVNLLLVIYQKKSKCLQM